MGRKIIYNVTCKEYGAKINMDEEIDPFDNLLEHVVDGGYY